MKAPPWGGRSFFVVCQATKAPASPNRAMNRMNPIKLSFLVASFLSAAILMAELKPAREPVASEGTTNLYFKTTPQGDLKANVTCPRDGQPGRRIRPS